MKQLKDYKNKKILIVGLAKSGYAASLLLHRLGASIIVNDQAEYEENDQVTELEQIGIEVVCGGHPLTLLDRGIELVVKNPGIRYDNVLIAEAQKRNIPIITEVELAYRVSEAEFIGITGSNGKTTTTMLMTELLKESTKQPIAAGNIGTVVSEVAANATEDHVLVTELSSFQLMGIEQFKPKVAVLLNIFDAHLDYHGSKADYVKAKANILKNQMADDYIVYNADDPIVTSLVENSPAKRIPFSRKQACKQGAWIDGEFIYFRDSQIISIQDIALPGEHNIENILAAVAVAKLYRVHNEWILRVLSTFQGVKHRLEYVTTINGRKFYNDSKATNILATEKAVTSFKEPVILLAGGLDRGNGFGELIPAFKKHVKAVVSFGETAKKIQQTALEAGIDYSVVVTSMEGAVQKAYELSSEGDVILLSPACASWDQYRTFEERGDMFVHHVHRLKV